MVFAVTVTRGGGKHALTLDSKTLLLFGQLIKAWEYLYASAVMFNKLAIIALYHQVFIWGSFWGIINGTAVVVVLSCIVSMGWYTAECTPFSYFWDKSIPDGQCGDLMAGYRWISVPGLVTDVVMLAIPLFALRKLQISTQAKLSLMFTLATATL